MSQIFSLQGARKIIFGCGSVSQIAQEAKFLKGTKVLLVVDQQIAQLNLMDKVIAPLKGSDLPVVVYSGVLPEPSPQMAEDAAVMAKTNGCDLVIGLGGGSALDVAKAAAMLVVHGGKIEQYAGQDLVPGPGLPTIMIPTTAGTGSEVTRTSVFTFREQKRKAGVNSPHLYPLTAVLDPELTYTVPPLVTAYTGMDALTHAIESFTSNAANPITDVYSLRAIELIAQSLRPAVLNGKDAKARENMLMGSLLAGLGLTGSGVGAAHALAYPLGAEYGLPHGLANAFLLAEVMEFNHVVNLEKFAQITWAMGENTDDLSVRQAAAMASELVTELFEDIGLDRQLYETRIPPSRYPELAVEAMKVTRPVENNPRLINAEQAVGIYEAVFGEEDFDEVG
ncbi:MAG: iron-containing alcohol dehydrogenase [Deltaproteobacteria bacterium]|nr:iron-containing alcohol dehydrogenase [Deltaproteobacteria bacterium]